MWIALKICVKTHSETRCLNELLRSVLCTLELIHYQQKSKIFRCFFQESPILSRASPRTVATPGSEKTHPGEEVGCPRPSIRFSLCSLLLFNQEAWEFVKKPSWKQLRPRATLGFGRFLEPLKPWFVGNPFSWCEKRPIAEELEDEEDAKLSSSPKQRKRIIKKYRKPGFQVWMLWHGCFKKLS